MTTQDVYLEWNGDFVITPAGSIQAAVGWDRYRQRIIRRLISNSQQVLPNGRYTAPDYLWDPAFGFGAGALVGNDISPDFVQDFVRRVNGAVLADDAVAPSPPPSVTGSQPEPNTLIVTIGVTLLNGTPGTAWINYTRGG